MREFCSKLSDTKSWCLLCWTLLHHSLSHPLLHARINGKQSQFLYASKNVPTLKLIPIHLQIYRTTVEILTEKGAHLRPNRRLIIELDLQRLFGLHVYSCTHWLRTRNSPHPPHLGLYTEGRYWSVCGIDHVSYCDPRPRVQTHILYKEFQKPICSKNHFDFLCIVCSMKCTIN